MHPVATAGVDDELEPDCAAGLPVDGREVALEPSADEPPQPGTEVVGP